MKFYVINEINNESQQLDLEGVRITKASSSRDDIQAECERLNAEERGPASVDGDVQIAYAVAEVEVMDDDNAYNLALEQARVARVRAKETIRIAFLAGCHALFRAHTQLLSFSWSQFRECHHDHRGDFIDYGAFWVGYHSPSINGIDGDDVDGGLDFDRTTGSRVQRREPSLESKLQKPVEEFLRSFDDNDFLMLFGDEVTVTVFRDGTIDTEFCDSD